MPIKVKVRKRDASRVLDIRTPNGALSVSVSNVNGALTIELYAPSGNVELRTPKGALTVLSGEFASLSDSAKLPDVAERLPHARAVARWARDLVPLAHEELWLLALDARNRLRRSQRVAQGGLSGLHVAVRDPLRVALQNAASSFVLVHNHPSGDPTPSPEDISFTKRLQDASKVMGCPLLDHVVIGREGFVSMLDAGMIES